MSITELKAIAFDSDKSHNYLIQLHQNQLIELSRQIDAEVFWAGSIEDKNGDAGRFLTKLDEHKRWILARIESTDCPREMTDTGCEIVERCSVPCSNSIEFRFNYIGSGEWSAIYEECGFLAVYTDINQLTIVTYCEGDVVKTVAPNRAAFDAECLHLIECYK
ncbi:hypothetical protein ACPV5U_19355 [Vibrio mediterranei]